ncbi:unnamed protein product [Cyprideis torosa]|uniref:Uncharacterized protein n=1 Tax=Cyprideis torosa TaxID=163714 RepID=A0A7R8WJG0_9CRUS|nr:unnamed protein product [Cyprideis torosa]CAG0901971.1 unnamed protein product [Cyprideis torosa]
MAVKKARVGVESGGGASVGVSFKRKDGAKHGVAKKKKTEKKQRRRKVPFKGLSAEDITGVSVKQEERLIEVEPDVADNLEEGDEGHQKLLDSISKIQGKSVQASDKRGAPVWSEASEFDMPSSSKVRGELGPEDLLQSLRTKDSKDHAFLRKKVAAKLGKKPLPTPLEKPQAERVSWELQGW